MDIKDLKARIKKILPGIIELRHELHRFPETKLEEFETAKRIRDNIKNTRINILPPLIETDTVGILYGRNGKDGKDTGKNVTLRADIDALPIEEKSGVPWMSQNKGCAHSCGHDGHTAILIGVLKVLDELTDRFSGSIRFVFQPAEEEFGGGKIMVEKGLLDTDPVPDSVFALHGWPGVSAGTISTRAGAMMAAADRFIIKVKGRGGHAARPHVTVDPVVTAARIINALQSIISRSIAPVKPAVISVCMIHGGDVSNVIPDDVVMEGTTRYFDPDLKKLISNKMEEVIKGICNAAGAQYEFNYSEGYIPLVNDSGVVEFARTVIESYLGREAWIGEIPQTMGAEDFAFYLKKIPGAFLRLGLGEDSPDLHSPLFDFNDDVIEQGIIALSALALETLTVK